MFLKAGDTINGQEGIAQATINGQIHDLFFMKSIEATAEKNKSEVKTIGNRATQHKTCGWSGSGSMTIYYVTSLFRKMMIEYIKTGKDTYFDLLVTNNDKTSTVGTQTTVLYNCNLDSTVLAKLDVDSDALEEDVDFTFDDADLLDEFGMPLNLQ